MEFTSSSAFYKFILEDKSSYETATQGGYVDSDDDFLIGASGGFLLNYSFVVKNVEQFSEVGNDYVKHGVYNNYEVQTIRYEKFRLKEERRRRDGYTKNCKLDRVDIPAYNAAPDSLKASFLKPLRITGEMYNFLNYTEMERIDQSSMTVGSSNVATKSRGLPRFFMSQYWLSKVREFIKLNGFNLIIAKARRAGFSYFQSSVIANGCNLSVKKNFILSAYDSAYLTKPGGLTAMVKNNLDFYETKTPFNRAPKGEGLLKKDIRELTTGYKDKNNNNKGYQSTVFSVSFGPARPNAAIGKDAVEIDVEELTNAPNLKDFMNVTDPATTSGSFKTGNIVGWGTTGSKEGSWREFKEWFYNPSLYNAMPFENVWDENSRHLTCGYFKPYWESLEGIDSDGNYSMDKDGNSNYLIAYGISMTERAIKEVKLPNEDDFILYCGQYANTPSEAFFTSSGSMFISKGLITHTQRVKTDPDLRFYRDGKIIVEDGKVKFITNAQLKNEDLEFHPYIVDYPLKTSTDKIGCIREWYAPVRDVNGKIPKDTYYLNYDTFGKDKRLKEVTKDHSLASIQVWMRPNTIAGNTFDRLVCSYAGRPSTMKEADEIALNMCIYYGADDEMLLVEVDRGETVSNFKTWKQLRLLQREPIYVWDKTLREAESSVYGITIGGSERKENGLQYLKEMLYEKIGVNEDSSPIYLYQYIYDIPFLEELLKYNEVFNFDRVSTAIVTVYNRKAGIILKKKSEEKKNKDTTSIFSRNWF